MLIVRGRQCIIEATSFQGESNRSILLVTHSDFRSIFFDEYPWDVLPRGIEDKCQAIARWELPITRWELPTTCHCSMHMAWKGRGIWVIFPLITLGTCYHEALKPNAKQLLGGNCPLLGGNRPLLGGNFPRHAIARCTWLGNGGTFGSFFR